MSWQIPFGNSTANQLELISVNFEACQPVTLDELLILFDKIYSSWHKERKWHPFLEHYIMPVGINGQPAPNFSDETRYIVFDRDLSSMHQSERMGYLGIFHIQNRYELKRKGFVVDRKYAISEYPAIVSKINNLLTAAYDREIYITPSWHTGFVWKDGNDDNPVLYYRNNPAKSTLPATVDNALTHLSLQSLPMSISGQQASGQQMDKELLPRAVKTVVENFRNDYRGF